MAFPTGTETSTTLASYIPAIWGEKVNEFFRAKLTCAPFFTNRSDEVAGGGNILYTPTTTEFTASAKSNAATVTLNSPTDTKVTLTIDQWYESSFAVEDSQAAQVMHSYTLMERYAKNAGYAIAKKLDVAITSLFSGFSGTVGSSTVNLADSDVRNAIALLESNDVDIEECEFFMAPNVFWKQVQAIDKFSLAINSPVNDPTRKMPAGYLYGRPVNVTTTIQYVSGTTGRYNALAHPDAIHYATSPLGQGGSAANTKVGTSGIRVQSNYVPQYLSTITTADILYGVIENRDNAGVSMITPA
jgi:hypothetical protein